MSAFAPGLKKSLPDFFSLAYAKAPFKKRATIFPQFIWRPMDNLKAMRLFIRLTGLNQHHENFLENFLGNFYRPTSLIFKKMRGYSFFRAGFCSNAKGRGQEGETSFQPFGPRQGNAFCARRIGSFGRCPARRGAGSLRRFGLDMGTRLGLDEWFFIFFRQSAGEHTGNCQGAPKKRPKIGTPQYNL